MLSSHAFGLLSALAMAADLEVKAFTLLRGSAGFSSEGTLKRATEARDQTRSQNRRRKIL